MKNSISINSLLAILFLVVVILPTAGQSMDITNAAIIVTPTIKAPVNKTVAKVLIEEIEKRTSVVWTKSRSWQTTQNTIIAIVLSDDNKLIGEPIPYRKGDLPEQQPEGYRIVSEQKNDKNIIWIIGADARGTLFGAGYLLRKAGLSKNKITLDFPFDIATAPQQSVRGHQLGYRNTANSYDAWDVAQYDQYIRELVIFGSNAIENIPFQDGDGSVHMPIPREEMNIRLGEICKAYDVDYWVWTPATFDLTDSEKRAAMLKHHEEFYKQCPKLDQIFFPGGDPGDNHPKDVMPFLKDLSALLVKHLPQAGVWISLQGFSAEQVDYFYAYLDEHQPDWLRGVVSGPSSPPTAETRYRLPAKYKHRLYPDINHNVRCEYPVQNWDQAFTLTIGREGTNPRPVYFSKIHALSL